MDATTRNKRRLNTYKKVIIILTLTLLNPSEYEHENEVMFLYGNSVQAAEQLCRHSTSRINFVLFSLTKSFEPNGEHRMQKSNWNIVGFGILGNVFILKKPYNFIKK